MYILFTMTQLSAINMPTKGVARRCLKINSEFNNDVYDKWRKAKTAFDFVLFSTNP